ncbi:N-6 DNA methylase [Campylobacter canadensis]|uniref:HsdM family class I SAM-dependent methyltransferase n=1 Tax=Campylobacter canadensis TaxID=449520 RepID=UPI001555A06B|nr:N-6 DNA methylase [Campylobacter canadensis]MBZ7995075.1 N-6 DNA methylase [Campylobacter canadensis]MBZ7996650.1 N-6 DNA methylase [Campylobacter canadensis]MBZ8000257.1 N-6 DNA methylase [Campylobacter canadensis]
MIAILKLKVYNNTLYLNLGHAVDILNVKLTNVINLIKIQSSGCLEDILRSIYLIYPDFKIQPSIVFLEIDEFIEESANLYEVDEKRKKYGRYYTPNDVCQFMIRQMFYFGCKKNPKIIDPTCGNSEFILEYIKEYIKRHPKTNIDDIFKNIYGNDINEKSIIVSKLRVFFTYLKYAKCTKKLEDMAKIINANFTHYDFVVDFDKLKVQYDYVIGNPPYVENSKNFTYDAKYGNMYANIVENSLKILKSNGILALVIPISYVSTPRMMDIRKYVYQNTKEQIIFSFADRPDSLFTSVHQKLNVLVAIKKNDLSIENCNIKTSNYLYWYANERVNLFDDVKIENSYLFSDFIPKIGDGVSKTIFNKVFAYNKNNLLEQLKNADNLFTSFKGDEVVSIFLNMRATFWIKCFLTPQKSKEYKEFVVYNKHLYYLYCILNSSLFFWFWNVVSDCWHITQKDLKYFSFVDIDDKENEIFCYLYDKLSKKLEKTKKYIGSRQTDYEYKHRLCKAEIDEIDNYLCRLYGLSHEEINYVIKFAERYRKGEKI